ncbi:MAG: ATP-binding cassette domain-containing protein [Candidatus Bipolaricaulota bacterium]|nr:ATP-binding cassette domain-containing protein [Candidatus Bipolaricaulota bacterium]MDW8152368.1 ATP-binding cassette domain-containing protein [Candidatus Bipolaricaulota bacterium]
MLEVVGVTKTFALGAERVVALEDVNLALGEGEVATVIGSNGAGKTTLLNVIAGTCRPDRGRIKLAGQDITRWPVHKRASLIGRVYQDPLRGTAAQMTVLENLALASRKGRRGLGPLVGRRRLALREAVAQLGMGLEKRLAERVAHLSGGERQALTVLMATLTRPKLLLLDEHTAALDPANAERVLKITEDLVRENRITTVMVTHRMDQALAVGERLVMMHKGRVLLDLGYEAKRGLRVEDLVALFRKVGVADDALLLAELPGNGWAASAAAKEGSHGLVQIRAA